MIHRGRIGALAVMIICVIVFAFATHRFMTPEKETAPPTPTPPPSPATSQPPEQKSAPQAKGKPKKSPDSSELLLKALQNEGIIKKNSVQYDKKGKPIGLGTELPSAKLGIQLNSPTISSSEQKPQPPKESPLGLSSSKPIDMTTRPYFKIVTPSGFNEIPNSPPYILKITAQNAGGRFAYKYDCKVIIIDQDFRHAILDDHISVHDEIPPGDQAPYSNELIYISEKDISFYVIFIIKYHDSDKDGELYPQTWFWKWDGLKHVTLDHTLARASSDDGTKIENHFKKEFDDFFK